MGCVPPADGFLLGLRNICEQYGAVLVFDEVMTGFRVAPGGAQELYGIQPDLTCLGKIVGGGMPVGAYGGRKDLFECLAPLGKELPGRGRVSVYQAGTLSGNPLGMAAGIATLTKLLDKKIYDRIERASIRLTEGLKKVFQDAGYPFQHHRVGSMFTTFFTPEPVANYHEALKSDTILFARYFRGMLSRGVYLAPSQFEAAFLSAAHSDNDIEKTIEAAHETLRHLQEDEK
jgi:glutamate-1-semialdehyde 2,1-aminomutase